MDVVMATGKPSRQVLKTNPRTKPFPAIAAVIAIAAAAGIFVYFGTPGESQAASRSSNASQPVGGKASLSAGKKGLEWVAKSKCGPIPAVKWWKNLSLTRIVSYVDRKHDGDWQPYIVKWSSQLHKLQDIQDRKSAIMVPGGGRLEGQELADYVMKVSRRVDIIHCLANEATRHVSNIP